MTLIVDVFKYSLIPGSDWFLLVAGTVGLLVLFMRPRAGRWLLTATFAVYWTLSTPAVAGWLEDSLRQGYAPLVEPADLQHADAIVVLGAGSMTCRIGDQRLDLLTTDSAYSVLEAVRLFKLSGGTALLITSGGRPLPHLQLAPESEVLRNALVELGVPGDRIVQDAVSRNTYEQALNLQPLLAAHGVQRFVLVASGTHMKRAMQLFHAQRLFPVPGPAPLPSDVRLGWRTEWLPSRDALLASREAAYHYLALVYAFARGWARPSS